MNWTYEKYEKYEWKPFHESETSPFKTSVTLHKEIMLPIRVKRNESGVYVFHYPPSIDDLIWILRRVDKLECLKNRSSSFREIWQGSYDVWYDLSDSMIYHELQKDVIKTVVDQGWLELNDDVYELTESGRKILIIASTPNVI